MELRKALQKLGIIGLIDAYLGSIWFYVNHLFANLSIEIQSHIFYKFIVHV